MARYEPPAPRLRPKHPNGCCRPTPVGVYRAEQLVDVQVHHHCGRMREHIRPAEWLASR